MEYCSNNSGGHWWLKDEDWHKLEAAGWIVAWARLAHVFTPEGDYVRGEHGIPKMIEEAPADEMSASLRRLTNKKGEDGQVRNARPSMAQSPILKSRPSVASLRNALQGTASPYHGGPDEQDEPQ